MPIARLLIIYSMDVLSYTTYHGQKLENYDLESLSNDELRKKIASLAILED